ncbi:Alpha/beta hydrolase fold-1 [Mycena sanguinolenta]|nr:Alpha/beta hydrolase fold-1 [Mycena sanguinolenta]
MQYRIERHRLTQERTGLHSLANRYVPQDSAPNGLVLVFAHSTSNHKEQWEAMISKIFELFPGRLNEMWAIDWQSHGESSVVNESALRGTIVTVEDYADILRSFLESHHVAGKRIVAVGHSIATCAWTLAVYQMTLRVSPVVAFVFFEPVHILPPILADDERILRGQTNQGGAQTRQTTFADREAASQWARRRMPWKRWDERVFKCYIEYGFKSVEEGSSEVTTSCDRAQELWQYKPNVPILAGHLYSKLCAEYPVHGIFGERPEMYSSAIRDRYNDGKEGRSMESTHIIPKTGHLLVQEKPETAAEIVVGILQKMTRQTAHL